MRIAFLGLGKMGRAIAERLLASEHELTLWNRTASAADTLVSKGAKLATSPAEAAPTAEVIFTMLADDAAIEQVVLAPDTGFLPALKPGAIHVSLSTISVRLSRKLVQEHVRSGSEFVAAPVFGRPNVAAEGQLWIAAGGKAETLERIRPLLESISRGITVVSSDPWAANALKIGGNFLITAMIESLSEAMVFAEASGVDPAVFLGTVNTALFRSPFYEAYGKIMLNPPERPDAPITLGIKDMGLFRQASQDADLKTPLADHFAADLARAIDIGLKDRDWAAGLYQLAKGAAPQDPDFLKYRENKEQ